MSSVCVTHILWASTNHPWGMKENPHGWKFHFISCGSKEVIRRSNHKLGREYECNYTSVFALQAHQSASFLINISPTMRTLIKTDNDFHTIHWLHVIHIFYRYHL